VIAGDVSRPDCLSLAVAAAGLPWPFIGRLGLGGNAPIHGYINDVKTGRLNEVAGRPKSAKPRLHG
jgi:hypothetical protein